MQQQARNARVRINVDPVALRQDVVILSCADFPGGRCVTGLWIMLRIYACIPHNCRQTIEMLIMVELRFFCRGASCRCRPRRSPVAGGTRLHPRQLLLDLGNLLLEGDHVFGRRFLVFEDVVVFGIVVFGGLIFVAGFFMRGFISWLASAGSGDANTDSLLRPCGGHRGGFSQKGFWAKLERNTFQCFSESKVAKVVGLGVRAKNNLAKRFYITIKIPFCDWTFQSQKRGQLNYS